MNRPPIRGILAVTGMATLATLVACASSPMPAASGPMADPDMGFFVTSAGSGRGGDLGGLAGADAICTQLAAAVGSRGKAWRAYLSAQPMDGKAAVDARTRIGNGPWKNAKGVTVATSVADLHSPNNNLNKQTALTEKGEVVNGRGDTPNQHDILTGSQPDGTAINAPGVDSTCGNWTRSGEGAAMVGHHDRIGLNDQPPAKSWNSSHQSRGCSAEALVTTGGNGRFYCFAAR